MRRLWFALPLLFASVAGAQELTLGHVLVADGVSAVCRKSPMLTTSRDCLRLRMQEVRRSGVKPNVQL